MISLCITIIYSNDLGGVIRRLGKVAELLMEGETDTGVLESPVANSDNNKGF